MTTKEGLQEMTGKFTKLFSEAGISPEKTVILIEDNLSTRYVVDFAPRKGRIPGAKWLEWYSFMGTDSSGYISHFKSPEEIREMCAELGFHTDDDIIIYCFKGARAANTYVAMKIAGFKHIRNYYGTWNEWSRDMLLTIDDQVLVA